MKEQPWLFNRLVDLGLLPSTMPIYAFSREASAEVSRINGAVSQDRISDAAAFPHEVFAIEMTTPCEPPHSGEMRTVTAVLPNLMVPGELPENVKMENAKHVLAEFRAYDKKIVCMPPVIMGSGKFISYLDAIPDALRALRYLANVHAETINRVVRRGSKWAHMICYTEPAAITPDIYRKLSGETVSFLGTACAVMASPAMTKETFSRRSYAPVKIGAKRSAKDKKIETRWTCVDINIDKAAPRDRGRDESRHGVALHPVRAHLRLVGKSFTGVRAHMRGDAKHGVRFRTGVVHRDGENK
jgi:hypothetical protein